jgi:hypothetical protein
MYVVRFDTIENVVPRDQKQSQKEVERRLR